MPAQPSKKILILNEFSILNAKKRKDKLIELAVTDFAYTVRLYFDPTTGNILPNQYEIKFSTLELQKISAWIAG